MSTHRRLFLAFAGIVLLGVGAPSAQTPAARPKLVAAARGEVEVLVGGQFRNAKPLQPGEVIDVIIKTPTVPDMDRNSYTFAHANGAVKTTNVAKIDMPKAVK